MEIKGTIEVIFDEQVISDSFRKREFVLRYADNPEYPELIKLEFVQDKTILLDSYKVGQDVTVSINLRGRKWTDPKGVDKYFNTLVAWKIDGVDQSNNQEPQGVLASKGAFTDEGDSGLPF